MTMFEIGQEDDDSEAITSQTNFLVTKKHFTIMNNITTILPPYISEKQMISY